MWVLCVGSGGMIVLWCHRRNLVLSSSWRRFTSGCRACISWPRLCANGGCRCCGAGCWILYLGLEWTCSFYGSGRRTPRIVIVVCSIHVFLGSVMQFSRLHSKVAGDWARFFIGHERSAACTSHLTFLACTIICCPSFGLFFFCNFSDRGYSFFHEAGRDGMFGKQMLDLIVKAVWHKRNVSCKLNFGCCAFFVFRRSVCAFILWCR